MKITKSLLFLGQRRGGSRYFGMDVTNADGGDLSKPPVEKLWTFELPGEAQSWARPVTAKVKFCTDRDDAASCALRDVVFISGGYSELYDRATVSEDDNTDYPIENFAGNVGGNAIYMIDRDTGTLLWTAGRASEVDTSSGKGYFTDNRMVHSFPTEPTVIDANFDGVADFLYALDIAGRVWRFDFSGNISSTGETDDNDIVVGSNNATLDSSGSVVDAAEGAGGIIAELSAPGDNRRFYNKLDVSLIPRTDNDLAKFALVTGSGYRAHPLYEESNLNRLYFLYDRNISRPRVVNGSNGLEYSYNYTDSSTDDYIKADDITQKTNNSDDLDTSVNGDDRHGFYIELDQSSSEKMLNPTITDDGIVLAVSYSPEQIAERDDCQKNSG